MYTSKLIQVLKNLTQEEIKDFDRHLNALIATNQKGGEKSLLLFKSVYKYFPDFDSPKLDKEKIFKKVYSSESYQNTGKLEKLMSKLLNILREFIVYRHSDINRELHQLRLMHDFFAKSDLDNFAEINVKKYQKIKVEQQAADTTFFYDSFLFERQLVRHQLTSNTIKTLDFSKVHLSLDAYYVFEKLVLACRLLAIRHFWFPIPINDSLVTLEHLKPLLESNFYKTPIINVYYQAFKFLNSEEEDMEVHFEEFDTAFKLHEHAIPEEQKAILVAIIRNYYVKQYHNRVEGYLEKTFACYKDHLEKEYLYFNGKLFAATMMNIVEAGLRLKEHDWVFNFIETHKEKITGIASPVEAYNLNLAIFHFYMKNYDQVLDLLKSDYEHVYYKLQSKRLEIKTYFETDHVLLDPKMDAFKVFIFRLPPEKISSKHKEGNRNFIDILKQVKLPKTLRNEKRIEKLVSKIHESPFIGEKQWLLEKLENLR